MCDKSSITVMLLPSLKGHFIKITRKFSVKGVLVSLINFLYWK